LGRVSDRELDVALKASDIAINPMFSGSGVNIKMLDYMSWGLPIVTTKCGARGIETSTWQPMIVSGVDKFAWEIKRLAADYALRKRMSEDSRSLVAECYDWKKISAKLQESIMERFSRRKK
jgi:glycosyltransferase involved in cell wall biosynthesis